MGTKRSHSGVGVRNVSQSGVNCERDELYHGRMSHSTAMMSQSGVMVGRGRKRFSSGKIVTGCEEGRKGSEGVRDNH